MVELLEEMLELAKDYDAEHSETEYSDALHEIATELDDLRDILNEKINEL